MPRTPHGYRRHVMVLMLIYIVLFGLTWPLVHTTENTALKLALTLAPLLPMGAALWLVASDIAHGDELQQRVHLIALSIATGIVSAASFAAGVLTATGFLRLGGDDLMFVLPAVALTYSGLSWLVGRRYGGGAC